LTPGTCSGARHTSISFADACVQARCVSLRGAPRACVQYVLGPALCSRLQQPQLLTQCCAASLGYFHVHPSSARMSEVAPHHCHCPKPSHHHHCHHH
jgi:hypothetical protein